MLKHPVELVGDIFWNATTFKEVNPYFDSIPSECFLTSVEDCLCIGLHLFTTLKADIFEGHGGWGSQLRVI